MDTLKYLSNCRVFSTVKQEEDEAAWLAARTRGIGGSDVGPICGVSNFTSARQIYLKKTGMYSEIESEALTPDSAAAERMHFGHMLEPIVANEYHLRTGERLFDAQVTLEHKDFPWALANVDRFIVDEEGKPIGILECKTSSEYNKEEWENGEIPKTYYYQLQWYLWITGLEWGAFACLVGGNKFYSYKVYKDMELLNNEIIPKVTHFWLENVKKLVEPDMQEADTAFVDATNKDCNKGSEMFFEDDTTNELLKTIYDCKVKIKELEGIMETAKNCIKDKLKDNEIGYSADYTVKWSPRTRTALDSSKVKEFYPDVYERCVSTSSYRMMTVKVNK